MKREEILNTIIEKQQKIVGSLQESVALYKTASDIDEGDVSDPDDLARQTEAKDMQLRFEKMLIEAKQNFDFIVAERHKTHTEIENGTLIETDKNYLFVGISVPVFKIDGKEVVSFSDEAPIFEKIKGKKIGDKIEMGKLVLVMLSFN